MSKRSCVLPLVLAVACAPAHSALRSVQAEARDPASGDLLYREHHLVRRAGGSPVERLVLYRCPDGTAFARKQVDYRASGLAPAFSLVDARDGYREGLRRENGHTLTWGGSIPRAAARPLDASGHALVADAGFDEFLRSRWPLLLSGGSPTLAFVVPSLGRSLAFKVKRTGAGMLDGEAVEHFRLELDGLLGWVGPSMEVVYAAGSRRLRRFEGLTNLRDDRGDHVRARIDFQADARPAEEAAWQAGLREPLGDCRLGG